MDYRTVFTMKRLWLIFGGSLVVMFSVLLYFGGRIYQEAPPMPSAVVSEDGETLFSDDDIQQGMDTWRRLGGMQLGSIWGHGAYLAPDWTADQLHREARALLDLRAGGDFDGLPHGEQAMLSAQLSIEIKRNTYDPASGVITVNRARADAIRTVGAHYASLFGSGADNQAFSHCASNTPSPKCPSANRLRALGAFFWWTSWAAVTNRPGQDIGPTSRWWAIPRVRRPFCGPSSASLPSSPASACSWFFCRERDVWRLEMNPEKGFPQADPLDDLRPTPSMRATGKLFGTVAVLFGLQILLGAITAHYAVEGHDFYGLPLSEYFPYALTRTWHTQLAITWIAVAWLAAGLFAAPLISGHEPKWQRLGVNVLWGALLVVTAGSLLGEWAAIAGYIEDPQVNFWIGHQGYEFLDLGRLWQILMFGGLLFWLALMARCIVPAIRSNREDKHLLLLLFASTVAIGLFYGAGLLWSRTTHLSIAEYWRWWVIHLWVEGIFEVFATAWVAWVFTYMRRCAHKLRRFM